MNQPAHTPQARSGERLRLGGDECKRALLANISWSGAREERIDTLIRRAQARLGEPAGHALQQTALQAIPTDSRTNLVEFGVSYGQWFAERILLTGGSAMLLPGTDSNRRFSSRATSTRSLPMGAGKRFACLLTTNAHSSLII